MGDLVGGDKIVQGGDGNIGKIEFRQRLEAARWPHNDVLMLLSNPEGTSPLRLLEEQRQIDRAIVAALHRDRLRLVTSPETRYFELQSSLPRFRPVVVHFSGHGSGVGGIVLADRYGDPVAVPPEALATTFRILGRKVRCVVLNACLTEPQAGALAQHVRCVVGTTRAVLDNLAIEFACGFYTAIANGSSVADAFDLGRNRIDLGGQIGSDAFVLMEQSSGIARSTFLHR